MLRPLQTERPDHFVLLKLRNVTHFVIGVAYLRAADKSPRLTYRPSQEQKGLDERTLKASQRPSHPW